ncbi:VCBS repeat-containing protein [Sphingomonas sabuli]|uniref:VCBS repeat-containing protein n=1 Tax=Sphingomonas sabuli TaxID=2764186 RepID=A0A7G9L2Z6_9SPHN|nr:FG-GAP-like repeat-containing protein [Sphingomonas sabuli]QNM82995.1 VCBS repeat-containing protein [Sphingomonas sabuli]
MPAPVLTDLDAEVVFSRPMITAVAQVIDTSLSFSDPDVDFNGAVVTVSSAGIGLAEDQFGIRNQGVGLGRISVVGTNVSYSGVVIGTYSGGVDGQTLRITLNASATNEAVEALLENLTYGNTSANPTPDRYIAINVIDAEGNDLNGGFTGGGFTQLEGAANPFNSLGSQQLSFLVTPTLFDYDNDGDQDIFTGGDDGRIRYLRNDGNGAFSLQVNAANPFNGVDIGQSASIVFLDLDGDGDRDAVIADGLDGRLVRYTNNGNGTFTAGGTLANRGNESLPRMSTYDVDSDGDQDLVVGGRDGAIAVYLNNLNNTLTVASNHPFSGVVLPTGSYPAPTFVDLDGDNDLDMVHGNSNGHFIFYRNSNGVFTQEDTFESPFWGLMAGQNTAPIFLDIDNDGDRDMIVGTTNTGLAGRIEVFRNDGVGWGQLVHVVIDPSAFWYGTPNADSFSAFTGDDWTIVGYESNDTLSGYTGNDVINGGSGVDAMAGGAGDDVFVVDNAGDTVTEFASEGTDQVRSSVSFTLSDNIENLTLISTGNVNGTGNALNNLILGNAGNNIIDGGDGADLMRGGQGDDTYYANQFGDRAVEANNAGNDTVFASINFRLANYVETLTLVGSAPLEGIGNGQANTINGNDGDNFIHGAGGADIMAGGAGSDIYVVENAGDQVIEGAVAGIDSVRSSVSFVLGANIEELVLTGAGVTNGTGNTLDNYILGNAAANILNGGAGNDNMIGGSGNDTLLGDTGADNLNGNNGTDALTGGAGQDAMSGGAGADFFIFANGDFGGATPATADRIRDFSRAEGDRIQLNAVDANSGVAGDQAFAFLGTAAFTGSAGQLRYEQIGSNTYLYGDTNGDRVADFAIRVDGLHSFVIGDFIL